MRFRCISKWFQTSFIILIFAFHPFFGKVCKSEATLRHCGENLFVRFRSVYKIRVVHCTHNTPADPNLPLQCALTYIFSLIPVFFFVFGGLVRKFILLRIHFLLHSFSVSCVCTDVTELSECASVLRANDQRLIFDFT